MSSFDTFQTRFLEELIAAATVLDSIESAAQAEAWVSGAVAEWRALSGVDGDLGPAVDRAAPLASGLISWFLVGELPKGDAPWIADLGRHELDAVLRLHDESTPEELALIFEYRLDGERDHDVSVSIDAGLLTGISIGPAGLSDGLTTNDATDIEVEEVGEIEAASIVSDALGGSLKALSPTSEANLPLLQVRFGTNGATPSGPGALRPSLGKAIPDRDSDDDAWCLDVVRSAMRSVLSTAAPASVSRAQSNYETAVANGEPDALTVLDVAGIAAETPLDLSTFLSAVGAYFAPSDLSMHTSVQFDALAELEPVDWVGVVLGASRSGSSDSAIDGGTLVTFINRSPEITSTIPKADAGRLAWTFDQMLFSWEATGVMDQAGRITEAGRWLLPHALVAVLDRALGGEP